MNSDGLAISLTFGGARGSGPGFGIPLVVRYLLEVAGTTENRDRPWSACPSPCRTTLTISDSTGDIRTAYVAPTASWRVRRLPIATNHRFETPADPAHAARYPQRRTPKYIGDLLAGRKSPRPHSRRISCVSPCGTRLRERFGTLYTADYRPDAGEVHYRWPGTTWTRSFDSRRGTAARRTDVITTVISRQSLTDDVPLGVTRAKPSWPR